MDIFLKCGSLLTILLLHVTLLPIKTVNASVTQWNSHENTLSGTTVPSQNNQEPVGENSVPESETHNEPEPEGENSVPESETHNEPEPEGENSVPESETHNEPEPVGENSAPEGRNDPEPTSDYAEPTSETHTKPKPTSETSEIENESEPTGESVAAGETPDTDDDTKYMSENTEPEPEAMSDNSPEPTGENAEPEVESETEPTRWNWGVPESEFGNGLPEFVEPPVYAEETKPPGFIYYHYYNYFGHGVGEEEAVDEMAVGEEENISPEDFQGTAELSEPESESWDSNHLREYLQNEEYVKNTVKQRKTLLMYTMACLGVLFVCLLLLFVFIIIRSMKRGAKCNLLDNAGYKKKILSFGISYKETGKKEFYA